MNEITGGPYILARLRQLRSADKDVKLVRYYEEPTQGMRNIFGDTDPDRAKYLYLNNKRIQGLSGPAVVVDHLIARGMLTKNGQLRNQGGAQNG